jgi:hypothetical protein
LRSGNDASVASTEIELSVSWLSSIIWMFVRCSRIGLGNKGSDEDSVTALKTAFFGTGGGGIDDWS